nr:MAG TPA: hypothetical protein [Caudoviricetes sp.]
MFLNGELRYVPTFNKHHLGICNLKTKFHLKKGVM